MHTVVLGAGFSGRRIAEQATALGSVCGTRREADGVAQLQRQGIPGCMVNGNITPAFEKELLRVTHLVVSVAPLREQPLDDPMLKLLSPLPREQLPALRWIGYLSTIGVYGDHQGEWVDEQTPCTSTQSRSIMRREAELAWQQFGQTHDVPVSLLRLSGIYGPGRNAVRDALQGRARMLIKPDQVFNRIHVDDLSTATLKAAHIAYNGILNITDDEPAPPQDVIRYAHALVGKPEPLALDFATADVSPMARSFYSENKRVRNTLSKSVLDFEYAYPDYRTGLNALYDQIRLGT